MEIVSLIGQKEIPSKFVCVFLREVLYAENTLYTAVAKCNEIESLVKCEYKRKILIPVDDSFESLTKSIEQHSGEQNIILQCSKIDYDKKRQSRTSKRFFHVILYYACFTLHDGPEPIQKTKLEMNLDQYMRGSLP